MIPSQPFIASFWMLLFGSGKCIFWSFGTLGTFIHCKQLTGGNHFRSIVKVYDQRRPSDAILGGGQVRQIEPIEFGWYGILHVRKKYLITIITSIKYSESNGRVNCG